MNYIVVKNVFKCCKPSYTGLITMSASADDFYLQKKVKDGKVYYYKRNRLRHKACVVRYRRRARLKVLKRLGNKCANPYNLNHGDFLSDPRCLQIDHINGDAKNDPNARPQRGGILIFNLLKMSDQELKSTYQLLCANCNWIKRNENKEWGTGGLGKKW